MRTIFAAAILSVVASQASAGQVWLTMDQVRPYELQKPAGQIVVGNPAIADVTVQDKERVFLFGKAPGMTNIYIFDDEGQFVDNLLIRVRATTQDMLVMHRGSARMTYNCTTNCEPTMTVGDETQTFTEMNQQVMTKTQQALQATPQ